MDNQPILFGSAEGSEEVARAELYGLLAQLWLAPPDAEMLEKFRVAVTQAPQPGAWLEAPWEALVAALRETSVAEAAAEFADLFQSVGKAEVFPFASFHLSGTLNEKPLARLRSDLAELGLGRDASAMETEDHIAYCFEVMRYLIAGDDLAVSNLEQQRRFFRAHLQTWIDALCETTMAHPRAKVWRAVAAFTREFMHVETQGFDLLEA